MDFHVGYKLALQIPANNPGGSFTVQILENGIHYMSCNWLLDTCHVVHVGYRAALQMMACSFIHNCYKLSCYSMESQKIFNKICIVLCFKLFKIKYLFFLRDYISS